MKKHLLALAAFCCLFFTYAKAQSYTYGIDSLFQHLDKSAVTTGILYDRAWPIANLNELNRLKADTITSGIFKQAYFEMYNSAYSKTNWFPTDTLNNRVYNSLKNNVVPVGLSYFVYNVIDTNAIQRNLIQMRSDSLYYDVAGRTASPYNTLKTFLASPLVDSVRGRSAVRFYFPSNLFINKSSLTLTSLTVDFNDGKGAVAVSLNTNYDISFGSGDGYRYLKFIAKFSDNSSYTTYARLKVYGTTPPLISSQPTTKSTAAQTCNYDSGPISIVSSGTFQGYDEGSATPGYGEFEVFFATNRSCDQIIRKPLVFVDGFDPGDTRKLGDIYNLINVSYNSTLYADYLRSQGFDIILVNFPKNTSLNRDGGADYIERNAQILISVLDYINGNKQGTEKTILVGPSMGGLISRYALAYMEQHNHVHNVKLWVSFDSPHLGANIPLGDQQWLNFFSDQQSAKDALNQQLNSPAAKQMLINHYLANKTSPGGAPGFRDRFVSVMNTIGFPSGDPGQPFRKIALVDGSLGGNELHSACQQGFAFTVRAVATIKLFIFKVRFKGGALANTKMSFTPGYGSSCAVFIGSKITTQTKITNFTTPTSTSGYDTAPGGTFNTQQTIEDQANGMNTWLFGFLKFKAMFSGVINDHSFISTKSALAFQGSNQDLSENVSKRNLACSGETPFNSYFGSFTTNYAHVALWSDALNWLTQEVNGNPQPPSVINTNSNYTISGPNSFCNNASYSLSNVPAGATVTWTASPSSAVTLAASGQQVAVTKVNTADVVLTANILANCTPGTANISFHEGGPSTPKVSVFLKNMNGYYNLIFSTPAVSGVTYAWTINGYSQGGNASSCTVRASDCNSGNPVLSSYNVQVTETNSCGSNTGCENFTYNCSPYPNIVDNGSCGGGGGTPDAAARVATTENVTYYPNPANEVLTVSTRNNEISKDGADQSSPYTYVLYNRKGEKLREGKSSGSDVSLAVADLPSETYFLHVTINGKKIEKQIIITH